MVALRVKKYAQTLEMVELVETRLIDATRFRMRADLGDLDALAASIRENGLIQPVLLRPGKEGFELVAGHRRLAACRKLKWLTLPCIVSALDDREAFELSLVENVMRETLDPVDEAKAFKLYVEDHGWGSVSELARRIKKSEEYVSHRIMLLNLPENVLNEVSRRRLNFSSAYELHLLSDPEQQEELAKHVIKNNLSVRETRQVTQMAREGIFSFGATHLWSINNSIPEDSSNERVYDQTVLALKMCLIRLDAIVGAVKDSPATSDVKMIRLSVHSLIDNCLNAKRRSAGQNELAPHMKSA
jgi:ParB family chromosome partitioning protein